MAKRILRLMKKIIRGYANISFFREKKKIIHILKENTQCQETEEESEPGSYVAEMLELSDQEFKATAIYMLSNLM